MQKHIIITRNAHAHASSVGAGEACVARDMFTVGSCLVCEKSCSVQETSRLV